MSLFDEIAKAEDVEVLNLPVPSLGGLTIQFRGMSFDALAEMQGSLDLDNIKETKDIGKMIDLIALTAFDPEDETHTPLFGTEEQKAVLRKKGYKTVLYLLTHGATVVMGVDEAETAKKGSTSTPEDAPASDESSSESPATPVEL